MSRPSKKVREIVKVLVREFEKLARNGDLDCDAKKIADAYNKLREERRMTREELDRKMRVVA